MPVDKPEEKTTPFSPEVEELIPVNATLANYALMVFVPESVAVPLKDV